MKRILVLALVFTAALGAAESSFWQQLTPEERQTAGIDRLTPAQQAALDAQVGRFVREGARQVREQVKQEVRSEVRQEVRAEVQQQVQAEVQKEVKKRETARAGLKPDEKTDIIRSRITGEFKGWTGTTVFRLENGQVWVQTDNTDSQWVETAVNPEVELRHAVLGGWKLYYLPKGYWVRVRRVQ
jgi:hypothetical protein